MKRVVLVAMFGVPLLILACGLLLVADLRGEPCDELSDVLTLEIPDYGAAQCWYEPKPGYRDYFVGGAKIQSSAERYERLVEDMFAVTETKSTERGASNLWFESGWLPIQSGAVPDWWAPSDTVVANSAAGAIGTGGWFTLKYEDGYIYLYVDIAQSSYLRRRGR